MYIIYVYIYYMIFNMYIHTGGWDGRVLSQGRVRVRAGVLPVGQGALRSRGEFAPHIVVLVV
jgi:hypothetical protein